METTKFNFDFAYSEHVNNQQIYQTCVLPLVQALFQGSKTTCFAYGQTGSGKTYTMLGDMKNQVQGLYLLAANDIFSLLYTGKYNDMHITVSFYEIYCAKLYDLLNNKNLLPLREDKKQNINVVGLSEQRVSNVDELMKIINQGMSTRVTSSNHQNDTSSRSHAILQINLKQSNKVLGKMNFVDLAGNERGNEVSSQDKQTRVDGAEINKSLLALKECIRALDQGKNHTPFRGSKLTLVLKESFMDQNCKLVMIGNISPNQSSSDYTLNTLRYSDRVKELRKPDNLQQAQQIMHHSTSCNQLDQISGMQDSSQLEQIEDQSCPMQFNSQENQDFVKSSFAQENQPNKNYQQMNQYQQYPNQNQMYNYNQQPLNVNINNQTNNFINPNFNQNYNYQSNKQQNDMINNEYLQLFRLKNQSNQNIQNCVHQIYGEHKQFINDNIQNTKQMHFASEFENNNVQPQIYVQQLQKELSQQKQQIERFQMNLSQFNQVYQDDIILGNKIKIYQNQMQQLYTQQPLQNNNCQNQYLFQQQNAPQLFNFSNQNQNPNLQVEDNLLEED